MGLPRVWGKVGVPEPTFSSNGGIGRRLTTDENRFASSTGHVRHRGLSLVSTIAYYILLLLGAFAFWRGLWAFTESSSALVQMVKPKTGSN